MEKYFYLELTVRGLLISIGIFRSDFYIGEMSGVQGIGINIARNGV